MNNYTPTNWINLENEYIPKGKHTMYQNWITKKQKIYNYKEIELVRKNKRKAQEQMASQKNSIKHLQN